MCDPDPEVMEMQVRYGDGLVSFEVADDSAVARAARENKVRAQFETHFGFVSAEQREQMVQHEMGGYDNAARALTTWCTHADEVAGSDETSYYVRGDGRHGWFHDPLKGGCGGITQTG